MISRRFLSHDPVVVPTDTIYGLAAPYNDSAAVDKIFKIKGRPIGKPMAVCIPTVESITDFADPSEMALTLIGKISPGPFTFVLPAVEGLPEYVMKDGKVALRLPDYDFILELAGYFGPMALTSANISGTEGTDSVEKVMQDLSDHELLVIEDDRAVSGDASEVVDLTGDSPMVLRGGKVKIYEILRGD
jgi:tRNA threonylcarbamoyl adenosine modification protein (Sua5/YciO/YrdC/YwlC family)